MLLWSILRVSLKMGRGTPRGVIVGLCRTVILVNFALIKMGMQLFSKKNFQIFSDIDALAVSMSESSLRNIPLGM